MVAPGKANTQALDHAMHVSISKAASECG
jgi:hypothetical protein